MAFEPTREGQLTEDKLKWGYWWVTHKVQVRRNFTIFLGILGAALIGYGGYGFLDWFYGSGVGERSQIAQMTRPSINYASFRETMAPQPLIIDNTVALNAGEGTYDIVARVTNPNMSHWVDFDFEFDSGSALAPLKRDFIIPGGVKFISLLGVKSSSPLGSAEVVITNIAWHRINKHVIQPDLNTWALSRLNFVVSDIAFVPPAAEDQLRVSRATFKVKNDTGFGYRKIGFFVSLIGSGGGLIGVNYVTISDLRPHEVRQVDASWFYVLPSVSRVEVAPDINIFDDRVYIPVGE
jgi:hypothetical protein